MMTTESVQLQARLVVAQVRENAVMNVLIIVCMIAALALALEYFNRRWSWIPRKKHNRIFIEKF